jgi:hypothetical protein
MKKLVLFGILVLSVIVANTVTAGHGSGWPGHHGGRCFIETVIGDNVPSNDNWFQQIFDFIWRPRA